MRRLRKIRRRAGGELAIEFDRRHPPRSADQLRENRRVVADPGADMYDMLPRLRRGGGDQRRNGVFATSASISILRHAGQLFVSCRAASNCSLSLLAISPPS